MQKRKAYNRTWLSIINHAREEIDILAGETGQWCYVRLPWGVPTLSRRMSSVQSRCRQRTMVSIFRIFMWAKGTGGLGGPEWHMFAVGAWQLQFPQQQSQLHRYARSYPGGFTPKTRTDELFYVWYYKRRIDMANITICNEPLYG